MKTILVTNQYTGLPLAILENETPPEFSCIILHEQTQEALENYACQADYILAGGRLRITKKVLSKATRLKMIQRTGVGLDSLDLEAIKEKGIPLYVNHGINAVSVAEHTLLLLLSCLRKLSIIDQETKNGIWRKQYWGVQTEELHGKTVGIIGMGNIAQTLVALLKPFNVKILYFSRSRMPLDYETENNMSFVGLNTLYSDSDVVTVHCALNNETKDLISSDALSQMKDGAILINTARGPIIDSVAVANALRTGKLAYAALDVHVKEPIPDDYPLKGIDNVILTPHIAGITKESFSAMIHDAFRNIEYFENGLLSEIQPFRYL